MKGQYTLAILEIIKDIGTGLADLAEAFLRSPYGSSYARLEYTLKKVREERIERARGVEPQRRARERFYKLFYKLKEDGLIKDDRAGRGFLSLTLKGKARLGVLKKRAENYLPPPNYPKEVGNKFVIVIFDIPERERRKRGWLRSALRNLSFRMTQKSVWLGQAKIPKAFLEDLHRLKLVDCIEIFEISKGGNLKHVV